MLKAVVRFFLTIIGFVCGFELFKIAMSSPIVATGLPFSLPTGVWFSALEGLIRTYFYFITPSAVDNIERLLLVGQQAKNDPQETLFWEFADYHRLLIGVLLNFPWAVFPGLDYLSFCNSASCLPGCYIYPQSQGRIFIPDKPAYQTAGFQY